MNFLVRGENMNKIAVLIPCYNESKTIKKVINDFQKSLPEAIIYVYDNNSIDSTGNLAQDAGAIVCHEYRQGKGNVIRSMFRDIDAECYIMVDGDDTYPAEFARGMVDMVLNQKMDMVIGDRLSSTYFEENKRMFHNSGNLLVRKMINIFWGRKKKIVDVMTGYRAFSPIFVKSFPILSEGFEIETEMTIHALDKNLQIASIPVDYRDRPDGSESKLNTYSDGVRVLLTIFKLYKDYQPLRFFGCVAVILSILSGTLFLPILLEYMKTGYVPRIPTLIVSGFIMVAAIQSVTCGLILDTETKKNRQDFELKMNIIAQLNRKSK